MSAENIREPVFICGCHRTGTTLLQTILSQHSEIDILPETKLYAWQWHPIRKLTRQNSEEKWREIVDLMPLVNRAWAEDENRFRMEKLLQSSPPKEGFASVGDLMQHLLIHAAKNVEVVGEKSPLHIYHVEQLLHHFPNAKIIITQRDLRGTFYSQSMRAKRKQLSYRSFKLFNLVSSWLIANQLSRRYFAKFGAGKIRVVSFESLVQDPRNTMNSICDFLGVSFEDMMLKIQFENSSFADAENISGVDVHAADRWKSQLDVEIKKKLDFLAGPELTQCGYEIESVVPSLGTRLTSSAIRATLALAMANPELICYLGRDPRYRQILKNYKAEDRG